MEGLLKCNIILSQIGHGSDLPETVPSDYESNDGFLKQAHHVLLEVSVQTGQCYKDL